MGVAHPELAGLAALSQIVGPARLTDWTVHIPLEIGDGMLGQQAIEGLKEIAAHIFPAQIEHQLVARLAASPRGESVDPIGVGAIQLTVGVDHLWLNPETKRHPKVMDAFNQRSQATGEFPGIGAPVS